MKTIDLQHEQLDLLQLLTLAQEGPIVIRAPDGREYVVAETDEFELEVAQLRTNREFQRFLDDRIAQRQRRRPVTDILQELPGDERS